MPTALPNALAVLLGSVLSALALAGPASAATVTVTPSLSGAGTITTPAAYDSPARSCSTPAPAKEDFLNECSAWSFVTAGKPAVTVDLTPTPEPGWTFVAWEGCPKTIASVCEVTAATAETKEAKPRALFVDHSAPQVSNLRFAPVVSKGGNVQIKWDMSELGTMNRCVLDGTELSAAKCSSGNFILPLAEGRYTFTLQATDLAGNKGPEATLEVPVVDTVLTPYEHGFVATTQAGDSFECSVDGGAFAACGYPGAVLSLPSVADGLHALKVRAKYGDAVDQTPASTNWMVDTVAPSTRLIVADGGYELESDDPTATFTCSLDGAPFAACASPYTLPASTLGHHSFRAVATDPAGNADATPAKQEWDTPAPPIVIQVAATPAALAAPSAMIAAATPPGLSFTLKYTFRGHRFTQLAVTALTGPADLRVTIRCPRQHCPGGFAKSGLTGTVNLTRQLGKHLPAGAKITIRATRGTLSATRTISVP